MSRLDEIDDSTSCPALEKERVRLSCFEINTQAIEKLQAALLELDCTCSNNHNKGSYKILCSCTSNNNETKTIQILL